MQDLGKARGKGILAASASLLDTHGSTEIATSTYRTIPIDKGSVWPGFTIRPGIAAVACEEAWLLTL